MRITRRQIASTSGRMWVESTTVCRSSSAPEASARDQAADLADLDRVEADGRLVEDQHRRLVHDRLGEPDALAVALRERADHAAVHVAQAAALDRAVDRVASRRARGTSFRRATKRR